MDDNRLVVAAL